MSNAEEICKDKLFKAYQQEMADLEITDEATYNPPVWVIEAMEEYANQTLQELKEKVEGKASEIEDAIEDQKEENLPVSDWLKGQIHAYLNVLQLIEEAINE